MPSQRSRAYRPVTSSPMLSLMRNFTAKRLPFLSDLGG
jgi:hypothetical protein